MFSGMMAQLGPQYCNNHSHPSEPTHEELLQAMRDVYAAMEPWLKKGVHFRVKRGCNHRIEAITTSKNVRMVSDFFPVACDEACSVKQSGKEPLEWVRQIMEE